MYFKLKKLSMGKAPFIWYGNTPTNKQTYAKTKILDGGLWVSDNNDLFLMEQLLRRTAQI